MADYTYQSVYFAYFLFFLVTGGALFFFLRSLKDGYLGKDSEEPKYRMLKDANEEESTLSAGATAPRRTL
jgi:hypothetical protein